MAFKELSKEKNNDYFVKAQLIKHNEYIISVFHGKTAIEANIVKGINNALVETRQTAEKFKCDYEFGNFPTKK